MLIHARIGIFVSAFLLTPRMTEQSTAITGGCQTKTLFDFTTANNVDDWIESSDTVREVGMSKAIMTLQKTKLFQRAIFFTLLNPQENGAGFAGVRTLTNFNLTGYDTINITCRAQGNKFYKVVLRHRGMHKDSDPMYEQLFSFPEEPNEMFTVKSVVLSTFKAYFRGRLVPNAEPLDTSNITMFGLQVYGGVYMPIKHKGVGSLEINTIVAERQPPPSKSSSTSTLDEGLEKLTLVEQ